MDTTLRTKVKTLSILSFVLAASGVGSGGLGDTEASAAAAARLMVCETQSSDGWNASITLEETGRGKMQVAKGGANHVCDLTLRDFSDEYRSRSSILGMRFSRGACAPALSQVDEKNLMTNIPVLFVRGAKKSIPKGRVQWLWNSQTTPCQLRVYNGPELVAKAERFKLGSWGHSDGR